MNLEIVKLINRYFTPFALFLILAAAFLGSCSRTVIIVSGLLVFISVELNFFTVNLISDKPEKAKMVIPIRVVSNFLINIVIVYFLIDIWYPIWLLFALTPIASAVYYDEKKCFKISIISAATLLLVHFFKGTSGLLDWGQAATYAVFIVLISMFINGLCKVCYMKSK
ncbi:MAG: hypothetical protein JW983_06315 [Elusimicrobia bacterium]|nr:hypothetical protein [Elusimicrobiota bacterium]